MPLRITTRFVDFAINTGEINITDSGQIFSFIHINDLVDALIEYIYYVLDIKFNYLNKLDELDDLNYLDVEIYNIEQKKVIL